MGQPLPAISNVLRLRLLGVIQGQPWASIQYAKFLGPPPSSTDLATIGTQLATSWQNAIAPQCVPSVGLRVIEVIDLSSDVSSVGTTTSSINGTKTGAANPNNMAVVASYKINRRYRGGHPRTYWPMGNAADVLNGRLLQAAFLPLASNAASAWVGNVNAILYAAQPLQHGCVSYYERDPEHPGHSKLRSTPLFFSTQTVTVHQRFDSQRRRLGKEVT